MGFGKEECHEQSQVNNITPTAKFRRNQRRRDWKQRPGVRARTTTAETGVGVGERDSVKSTHRVISYFQLYFSVLKYPFESFLLFENFEITGNSYAVVKNSIGRSLAHFTQFSPKVTFYKTIA